MAYQIILSWCGLCLLVASSLYGQRERTFQLGLNGLYSGEAIDVFDLTPPEETGSVYYQDEWLPGAIKITDNKQVADYPMRFNIERNTIEIKLDSFSVELAGARALEFMLVETNASGEVIARHQFVNAQQVGIPQSGFAEILVDSAVQLLKLHEVEYLKPDYVPALNTGSKVAKAVKEATYYLFDNSRLIEIPTSKRQALRVFTSYSPELAKLSKTMGVNPKKEKELVDLWQVWQAGPKD